MVSVLTKYLKRSAHSAVDQEVYGRVDNHEHSGDEVQFVEDHSRDVSNLECLKKEHNRVTHFSNFSSWDKARLRDSIAIVTCNLCEHKVGLLSS